MPNTQILPDAPTQAPDTSRGTFSPSFNLAEMLRDMERTYGTAALANAMDEVRRDREFDARRLAAHPDEVRSIRALLATCDPSLADELEPTFADIDHATPYPGVLAA
jgi:hypothetical protein